MLFAFATLKELNKRGHKLILWTFRHGEYLDEAVEYCKKNGVEFYAVNKNFPEEVWDQNVARKLNADIFVDLDDHYKIYVADKDGSNEVYTENRLK